MVCVKVIIHIMHFFEANYIFDMNEIIDFHVL